MRASIAALGVALLLGASNPAAGQDAAPPPEWPGRLESRIAYAYGRGIPERIAEDMMAALAEQPRLIENLDGDRGVWQVIAGLERDEKFDIERRLLAVLVQNDWSPADQITPRSNWYDARLALRLIEAGDLEGARAVLAQTEWLPDYLVEVMTDRRYEQLWPVLQETPEADFALALEREIAIMDALQDEYPTRLEPIWRTMMALRRAGRAQEAAQLGADMLAAITDGGVVPEDGATEIGAALTQLARALSDIGEADQARAVMGVAANQDQFVDNYFRGGGNNVSRLPQNITQTLNYALLLVFDGHPEEALAMVDDLRNLSDESDAFASSIRACAYEQLSNRDRVEDAVSRLSRVKDQYPTYAETAFLCANRIEDGVQLMIWRLEGENEDPYRLNDSVRKFAITLLQSWRPPEHRPSFQQLLDERRDLIRNDPRVLEALEPYGRILNWDAVL